MKWWINSFLFSQLPLKELQLLAELGPGLGQCCLIQKPPALSASLCFPRPKLVWGLLCLINAGAEPSTGYPGL